MRALPGGGKASGGQRRRGAALLWYRLCHLLTAKCRVKFEFTIFFLLQKISRLLVPSPEVLPAGWGLVVLGVIQWCVCSFPLPPRAVGEWAARKYFTRDYIQEMFQLARYDSHP